MAKFVLAGKADCPYFAKAEVLADFLQGSLPNFRIHKISIHPDQWQGWLETTCKTNGWKHDHSPLIWRELVDRGGKGTLLGGFSEFLEHCQDYFGLTSDISSDLMLKIAAENLGTKLKLTEEEQHHLSFIQPLHIWISSALHPTCYTLLPHLLSTEVFPGVSTISLHLLEQAGSEEELHGLRMEAEDLALPLLRQVTVHTDLSQAFQEAHVIIMLDDCWPDDSGNPENEEEDKTRRQLRRISFCYQGYGQLIDQRAHKEVIVIVAGDSFVNLKCTLLLENARSIDSGRFVAMATQLEYEARAHIAKKMNVRTSDITDVTVWGNISGSFYVDLERAKVFNYDGAIKGPAFYSQPVLEMLYDRKWLKADFPGLVISQRATVVSKTHRPAAMATTNGILTVLKAWSGNSKPNEVLSVGVPCPGHYNLPDGEVFSMPVTFKNGKWTVFDVTVGDELREKLQISADELREEKQLATKS